MADRKPKFEEINVERINIIEKDGMVKMVMSNKERLPDPVVDGRTLKRSGIPTPGMIFYNDEGDECGGLIFGSAQADGKGKERIR